MMPLTMMKAGEQISIKKLSGQAEARQHLENLGFVPGTPITIIAQLGGNVIVSVKESRVAISREMAGSIWV